MKILSIKKGITEIPTNKYYGNTELGIAILPETIVKIGHNAFAECANLREIVLPKTLKYVGCNAFEGCTKLKKCWFGEDIKSLGECVFMNSGIEFIAIPSTIELDYYIPVFYGCLKLKTIVIYTPQGHEYDYKEVIFHPYQFDDVHPMFFCQDTNMRTFPCTINGLYCGSCADENDDLEYFATAIIVPDNVSVIPEEVECLGSGCIGELHNGVLCLGPNIEKIDKDFCKDPNVIKAIYIPKNKVPNLSKMIIPELHPKIKGY